MVVPTTPTPTRRTLSTAEERREAVLEAAMEVFAERGFLGTPTMPIAKAAGISQAYLFRLFPTKEELVLAVVRRSNERIVTAMAKAAARAVAEGAEPLQHMGEAYAGLVADRRILMTQLHQHAAAVSDPAIAQASRDCFQELVEIITGCTEHPPEVIQQFVAMGMLINVMTASGVYDVDAPWARILGHDTGLCSPAPVEGA